MIPPSDDIVAVISIISIVRELIDHPAVLTFDDSAK
jgi:hypothetical protein